MFDDTLFEEVIKIRRDIHQNPETGFDVERTASIAADTLDAMGLTVKRKVGRTGVVCDLEIPGAKRRVALRADMDALPIQEERDSSYKSKIDEKAHLCGHDAHTAMLIGTAKFLKQHKNKLASNVRFIFQPSEELQPGGAPGMIEDGCLEGVDEIYALHVWPWLDTGTVGICHGPTMAQADSFEITIQGRGGHAAAPHQNIDPIVIGSHLVTMLQTIISRYVKPLDPAVLSVTTFHSGSAFNVIPSQAKLTGTVRTYSTETQKTIRKKMEEIIKEVTKSFGAAFEFLYDEGYPPVINHAESCDAVKKASSSFLENSQVIYPAERAMFGEDFAYYLQKVPGCFIQLGCRNEEKECIHPLHHPCFNLDEECMKVGIRLLSSLALTPF